MNFLRRTSVALFLSFGVATFASAKEMVVSPFLPRNVDKLVALNITSLVSSELDFTPDYELVTQLEDLPKGMNVSCINKASCLRPIGRAHNANHLIAGSVAPSGRQNFQVYMVLFDTDRGTFIRKKTFTVSRSPDVMADSIANVVNVLLTGREKTAPVDESAPIADGSFDDFVDGEDDFDFDEEPISHRMNLPGSSTNTLDDFEEEDPLEVEGRNAAEERRRNEEAEAARRAEQRRRDEEAAAQRAEERRRADEIRRQEEAAAAARRAADERRRAEEAEARRRAEERQLEEEEEELRRASARTRIEEEEFDDVDDFEFGAISDDDIGVDDFQFGSAVSLIEEESQRNSSIGDLGTNDRYGETEFTAAPTYETVDTLDDPEPSAVERPERRQRKPPKNSRSSRSSTRIRAPFVSQGNSVGLTARAGISKFQTLNFLTYGVELAIPMSDRASLTAGIEFQSTKRSPTIEQQVKLGLPPEIWNTIMPLNVGGLYRFGQGRMQPFVGADLVLTPYTKDFKVAVGARARAGTDIMITKKMGVSLGLSTGAWYGSRFDNIEEGLKDFGIVPQATLGTSILF